jgi:hypothetical protein
MNRSVSAPAHTDMTLTCADCGAPYVFTAAEQEFHDRKAFTNVPARCPACRTARQATRGHYSSPQGRAGWL